MRARRIPTPIDDKQYFVVQFDLEHFELFQHGHMTDTGLDVFLGRFKSKVESLQAAMKLVEK